MNRTEAARDFRKLTGTPLHQVIRLLRLCEAAEQAQTDWHNGDGSEQSAESTCVAFEAAAAKLGFECDWPGLFPILVRDGQQFHLPDYEEEPTRLHVGDTERHYCFDIMSLLSVDYHHAGEGIWHHEANVDDLAEDYDDKYDWKIGAIDEIIDNYCRLIPGLTDVDYYGEYNIKVNLRELEEGGWDEGMLATFFESIVEWMNDAQPLITEGPPWFQESTDNYGNKIYIRRIPDLILPNHPNLEGWATEDQTDRMRIGGSNGDRRFELWSNATYQHPQDDE